MSLDLKAAPETVHHKEKESYSHVNLLMVWFFIQVYVLSLIAAGNCWRLGDCKICFVYKYRGISVDK